MNSLLRNFTVCLVWLQPDYGMPGSSTKLQLKLLLACQSDVQALLLLIARTRILQCYHVCKVYWPPAVARNAICGVMLLYTCRYFGEQTAGVLFSSRSADVTRVFCTTNCQARLVRVVAPVWVCRTNATTSA